MNRQRKKYSLSVLTGVLSLIIILTVCGICLTGATVFSDDKQEVIDGTYTKKTITVNEKDYFPRQDTTVVLAMGIDTTGEMRGSGSYNNPGEADVVSLIVFDQADKTVTILNLNRDTMVEMPVLGIGGKKTGSAFQQLALAHTYGSGMEDSCENTVETVSAVINNVYIDYYIAVNMDAVAIINDAVGGVNVTVTDDFSQVDDSLPTGPVILYGQQAVSYLGMCKGAEDKLNFSRMERHSRYMGSFITAFTVRVKQSDMFLYSLYEDISPYMVTDCPPAVLSSLMDRYAGYTLKEIVTPKGENVSSEKSAEFYPDESDLGTIILDIFYREKVFY